MKIQIETTNLFTSKEAYLAFREAWRVQANKRQPLSPAAHLLYLLLRGKDARTGFTPITNANRLRHQVNGKPMATLGTLMVSLRRCCAEALDFDDARSLQALRLPAPFKNIGIDPVKFANAVLAANTEDM